MADQRSENQPRDAPPVRRHSRWPLALTTFAILTLAGLMGAPLGPEESAASAPAIQPEALRSCAVDDETALQADRSSRVLLGLAAHVCEDSTLAMTLLDLEPDPSTELEDWRLHALAQAATAAGDLSIATGAADELLLDHGDSPLRHRTYALRTRLARLAGLHDPETKQATPKGRFEFRHDSTATRSA